jgi:hypothetical protein
MNNVGLLVIVCLCLILYFNQSIETFINYEKECDPVTGRCFDIVAKYPEDSRKDVVKNLIYLHNFATKILSYMRKTYLWAPQNNKFVRHMIENLLTHYNPDNIIENDPPGDVNTSYVQDKGIVFAMCMREKVSGMNLLHDKNILEFVLLHEMSHLSNDTIGHDNLFWMNFKVMLTIAKNLGLHTPVDYGRDNINYCSLIVDYNPYFDDTVPNMLYSYDANLNLIF